MNGLAAKRVYSTNAMSRLYAILIASLLVAPAASGKKPPHRRPPPASAQKAAPTPKAAPGDRSGDKPAPTATAKPAAPQTPAPAANVAPAAPVASEAPPVATTVARIQKFYEGTQDLHARFDQELTAAIGGKKKASGDVWLKKPGRMRWEYQKPERKLMVADGSTLWVYEPEDEQAFRQALKTSSLPSSVTFLLGTGKLSDEFDISYQHLDGVGAPGDLVLKLVPRQATAAYRNLDFVVDPKTFMVKETVVHDQQGGVNHLRFHDVETNKGLANSRFEFTPPAGTRILKP